MGTLAKDAVTAIMGANDQIAQGASSNEPVVEGLKKELVRWGTSAVQWIALSNPRIIVYVGSLRVVDIRIASRQ